MMTYYQKHVVNLNFVKNFKYNFKDETLHSERVFGKISGENGHYTL